MNPRRPTLTTLFHEAHALPPEEREAFLETACTDSAMREELRSLLEASSEAAGFFRSLEDSVVRPAWQGLHDAAEAPDPLSLEGEEVGPYMVEQHLGGGGMGVVYRAVDSRLGRPVALKFLWPHLAADLDAERRFAQEARSASRLDHPGIAAIYEIAAGSAYRHRFIAMAYCEGTTLKDRLLEGALPHDEAIDYGIQIVEALSCAHFAGIVHRDVKPANVIVSPDGRTKLVDFGLAKAVANSVVTATGRRLGTAAYMSPEQARGERIDARADLWSVGVLLYESLTGERPFRRDGETATIYAILHDDPPPLGRLRPGLPADLDHVIERCLAKDPAQRYDSAEALLSDLRAVRRGERIEPSFIPLSSGPELHRSIAVLPFETVGQAEPDAFTLGIHGEVITRLSSMAELQVISRTSVRQYENTNKTVREIGEELGARWILEGEVQETLDEVLVNVRLIDAQRDRQFWATNIRRQLTADGVFEMHQEITTRIAEALQARQTPHERARLQHAPTENLAAYRLYAQGRGWLDQRTEVGMRRSAEYFRRAIREDAGYALAWVGLADALGLLVSYGYEPETPVLAQADEAAERALAIDPESAEAYASLGLIYACRREGPESIAALSQAVDLRSGYAEAHNWLAWVHLLLGNGQEALNSARTGVEHDPLSPEAVSNMSLASLVTGDRDGALLHARRAYDLQPDWPTSAFYVALALYHMGRYGDAREILEGLHVPWAGMGAEATLALALIAVGDESGARQVLADLERSPDSFAIGLVHAALRQTDAAYEAFERVEFFDAFPAIAVHFLFPGIVGRLRRDPRWKQVERAARRDWGMEEERPSSMIVDSAAIADSASIAILPFTALGDDSARMLGEAIHDDLLTRLSGVAHLAVTSRTSVLAYRDSRSALPVIARELGVSWILEGSIQRLGGRLAVRVRLVDAASDRQVWTERLERHMTADNVWKLQAEITRKIAGSLDARLTPAEQLRVDRRPTENLQAHQLYVQGRGALREWTPPAMRRAAALFRDAIERDPGYALAWAGLADALSMLEYHGCSDGEPRADPLAAASRAIALGPEVAEAHASLGIAYSISGEAALARKELERAIEMQPSNGEAHAWLAWLLLVAGLEREATGYVERAVALNPLAPSYRVYLAEAYLANDRGPEALREARRGREIQPEFALVHFMEGLVLNQIAQPDLAIAAFERAFELVEKQGTPWPADVRGVLASAYVQAGREAEAKNLMKVLAPAEEPFACGLVHAALGDTDAAIEAFGTVSHWKSLQPEIIRYFLPHVLNLVREDPRFRDVLNKVDGNWSVAV